MSKQKKTKNKTNQPTMLSRQLYRHAPRPSAAQQFLRRITTQTTKPPTTTAAAAAEAPKPNQGNVNNPILPAEDAALLGKGAKPTEQQPIPVSERYNPATGEYGGPLGPEPTRYGDFEKGGRCYDF